MYRRFGVKRHLHLNRKERERERMLFEIITKFVPFVLASQKIVILTFMTLTVSNWHSSLAVPIAATMNFGLMTVVCSCAVFYPFSVF